MAKKKQKKYKTHKAVTGRHIMSAATLIKMLPSIMKPNSHEQYAAEKIWLTEKGEEIPYKDLKDKHLESIINLLEAGKTNRKPHYKGILQEQLRRQTKAGKLLYG